MSMQKQMGKKSQFQGAIISEQLKQLPNFIHPDKVHASILLNIANIKHLNEIFFETS